LIPRPAFVFLDFDGVIMDSMGLKLDSYCHAFEGLGFDREAIRKVQLESAGLSRHKTIPLMYETLSGRPIPEDKLRECLERFGAHDEASRAKMVLKEGAEAFLDGARASGIPLAIVTGTPQEVIDRTIAHFGLGPRFVRVCGAPTLKRDHLRALLREFSLDPGRCLYVGDAILDQEAAVPLGIPFIGVNNGDDPFRPEGLLAEVRSLGGILELFAPA
jgi:phosphoglycolate phosphatase